MRLVIWHTRYYPRSPFLHGLNSGVAAGGWVTVKVQIPARDSRRGRERERKKKRTQTTTTTTGASGSGIVAGSLLGRGRGEEGEKSSLINPTVRFPLPHVVWRDDIQRLWMTNVSSLLPFQKLYYHRVEWRRIYYIAFVYFFFLFDRIVVPVVDTNWEDFKIELRGYWKIYCEDIFVITSC